MAAPTLGGVSLGHVSEVNENKEANIEIITRPRSDSSLAINYDFFGATRALTISGKIIASNVASLKTAVDNLRNLIDGDQVSTVSFVSDITGTVKVIVNSISGIWSTEGQGQWDYSITITEGLTPGEL